MHSDEAKLAEYRKFLAFIDKKLAETQSGALRVPEATKLELQKNAADLKHKIANLEGGRQAAIIAG